jgi:ribulose 1,5-bisphosphate synthetase/thiazole synthase
MQDYEADVLIVGAGPTGLALANVDCLPRTDPTVMSACLTRRIHAEEATQP